MLRYLCGRRSSDATPDPFDGLGELGWLGRPGVMAGVGTMAGANSARGGARALVPDG